MFGRFGFFDAFRRDRRGNVAMLWALAGSALIGLVGLSVDFTRAQAIHTQLQNAADGAALAAARATSNVSMADRTAAARAFFDVEAGEYAQTASFSLVPTGEQGYRVDASTVMPGGLTRLISQQDWTIHVESEAVRGGVNLEVALVLDTTGSMAGQRITDLRNSAGDLVDIVVSPTQTPYYSKVALVTWGMGVNAGPYANSARGDIPTARTITGAAWATGTAKTITGATRANPVVITSNGHGFTTGQVVYITGVKGMTQLNNHYYTVGTTTANTFQLKNADGTNVNGTSYGTWQSGGTQRAQRCLAAACQVVVTTSSNHGFADNAWVYLTGVGGMTQINNSGDVAWQVTGVTATTFTLSGSTGPTYSAYTSGGSAYCTTLGCQYYRFTNASNATRIFPVSTCVSERTGANSHTDAAPSVQSVGLNYAASGNPCDSVTGIIPLTTDTAALHSRISALTASGSTAGQIGTAWGWYALSPNWGYLWPSASQRPAAYGAPETQKIAVLMTDGAFNSPYCNGVIARDAISGSGSTSDHNNCDSPNGSSANQTIAICNAMKQQGIIVYTVGFHIGNDSTALNVFHQCATDDSHFYLADDGTTLQEAFRQIGQSISQLRLSH